MLVAVGDGVSVGSGVSVGVDVGTTTVGDGVCVGSGAAVAAGSDVDVGEGSGVEVNVGVLVAFVIPSDVGVTVGSTRTTCATVGVTPIVGATTAVGSAVSQAQTETANTKPTAITVNRISWTTDRGFMGDQRAR